MFDLLVKKFVTPVIGFLGNSLMIGGMLFLALLVYSWMKYRFPFRLNDKSVKRLETLPIRMKLISFLRWMACDYYNTKKAGDEFREYGLTFYCGRQGAGKTISMIHYANMIHRRYPKCIIVSNFDYVYSDRIMESWRDLLDIRNGTDGVLFMIDEIHSEYSTAAWKDFPEDLLSEISQQRKQRIKIVATSQQFMRVVKQLREQAFTVVQCKSIGVKWSKRWTFNHEYDAKDYEFYCESFSSRKVIKPINKRSFVQSDFLRGCYDTYQKIERMQKLETQFIPRHERGA